MDDPSLQSININILHNYTAHNTSNTAKSSFRKRFRADTVTEGNKKRVTFPCEGIVFESRVLIAVMAKAKRKEKNEVVKKVGSASTWGRKERDRFGIPQEGVEVDAFELVGREWFDMNGLDGEQRESMMTFVYIADGSV
jgi:hypothetical protein